MMGDYIQVEATKIPRRYFRSNLDPLQKEIPFQIWKTILKQIFGLHKSISRSIQQKQQSVLSELTKEWKRFGTDSSSDFF